MTSPIQERPRQKETGTGDDSRLPVVLWGLWGLLLALGLLLRLWRLGQVPLFGDEYHTLVLSQTSWSNLFTTYDIVGSHVALPVLQRLCFELFGENMWSHRLVGIVPGFLLLALLLPLGRRLVGPRAALAATALAAVSPMFVYYSRFSRTYALMLLLGFLLMVALTDLLQGRKSRRALVVSTLCVALLPWVHLSSAGFLGAVLGAAFLAALYRRDEAPVPGAWKAVLASGVVGGVLALALYLPVEGVHKYITKIPEENRDRPQGVLEIVEVLAGARPFVWLYLFGLPLAVLSFLRRRPRVGFVLAASCVGPLLLLVATRPHGMAYAWARYLMTGLPAMLLLLGHGLEVLQRRLRLPDVTTPLAGVLLAVLAWWLGPLGPGVPSGTPYSNTYLAMKALPAFDVPFDEAPGFYRELAEDPEAGPIIESMPFFSRAVLLYRNYTLIHGKPVYQGWSGEPLGATRGLPYVAVRDPEAVRASGATHVVLHLDLPEEVERYWAFVYDEVWPARADGAGDEAGFMTRNNKYWMPVGRDVRSHPPPEVVSANLRRDLQEAFGRPVYRDDTILVYKVRDRAARK